MTKALTAISVAKAKPGEVRREVPDGAGLYLVIQPGGGKSWAYRYRHNGKPKKLTLGTVYAGDDEPGTAAIGLPLTLASARRLAADCAVKVSMGTDPAAAKVNEQRAEAQRSADLIENVVADFLRLHAEKKTRAYSAYQSAGFFRREVLPKWSGRAVQSIKRREIVELLDAIVERGSPVSANRTLSHLSKFFAWCVGRDIIEVSPCIGVERPTREVARDRVLSDEELALVWRASDKVDQPFGAIVKMLILTLQRKNEVAKMARGEINGDIWTLPANRAKNYVETDVPLSAAALDVLSKVEARGGYVFTVTGEKPYGSFCRGMERLNREICKLNGGKPLDHWTPHDLRRTGGTGLQKLGTPVHITEKILNHVNGSFRGIVSVYQKHDYASERRAALEAWSRHVLSLTTDKPESKVLNFSRK
jgi:integrase